MPHVPAPPVAPATHPHAVPALAVAPRGAQLDAEAALRLLAEAGEVLSSSLEVEPTLEAVARLAVPAFADSCTIDLLAPDGALARVTAAHRDPAAQARLRGLRERFPLDRRRPHPVNRALETGEIQLVPAVTDELLAQWAGSEEERREAEHVRATSAILAPLRARGRTLGVVSFGTFGERQPFSAADLPLAQDLARRAALAVDNARLFEAERAARALSEVAADRTARLQAVTAALSQPLSRADAARVIVGQIVGALGGYAAGVLELSEDGSEYVLLHAEGFPEEVVEQHRRYPVDRPIPVRDVARTREPVLLGSVAEWVARYPGPPGSMRPRADGAWAALPLLAGDRLLGALTVSFSTPRAFSSADREFMMAFARHCAQALERARLHEGEWRLRARAEKAAERTGRLQAVTAALTGAASPAEVAAAVVEEGAAAVDARSGSLILLTPEGGHLELAHGLHVPASLVEHYRRFPLDAAFPPAEVVRTGEPVFVDTLEERAARYPLLEDVRRESRTAAVGSVPVAIEGRVLGALSFALPDDAPGFAPEDRALLVALGRLCAHALERARLYEEAQRARAEAEAANRAKAEFLAVLSHELRTPLNAIGGYADLMLAGVQGPLPPGYRSYVERITAGQRHLLGLINAVLSFARVEAGHVTWELETFALADVLAALETLVEQQVRARGLAFACPPCDPSLAVHADREKVSQVVLNLLSNAVKFTEGGGWVAVEAAADDDMVEVRVADSGVGIPPDRLEQIFEPFVQVDSHLTRAADGVGLGLSISRELARGMGGELSVRSAPGQGSVFVLRLPRAAAG